MIKIIRPLFFLLLSINLFSQTDSRLLIQGRVTDSETGLELTDANVEILNTTLGAAADKQGLFEIPVRSGSYDLRISMMGYQTHEINVQLNTQGVLLDVALVPTVYLLQGVTIIQPSMDEEETTVSNTSIQSENVVRMPGSLTDIYRSVKTLPGVASNNGMSSEFNVRGGTFDENLVIVNGAQVYRPFHIKEAANASIAIFNMDLLKQVDLITGGFTARYGDKMSSVMNIQYRQGSRDRFKFQATASLMHAGLVAEGPSYKGSWILGIRKSYMQYLLDILDQDDAVQVDFYDIQGQIQCVPGPGKQLTFQLIHSGDNFQLGPKVQNTRESSEQQWYTSEIARHENDHEKADYYNNLYALSFTHAVNPSFFYKTIVSHYAEFEDENDLEEYTWQQNIWDKYYEQAYYFYSNSWYLQGRKLKIFTTEARQEATVRLNAFHEILAGVSFKHLEYDYTYRRDESYQWGNLYEAYPDTLRFTYEDRINEDIHPKTHKLAGFVEDSWQVTSRVFANVGLRMDYFDFNRDLSISPRINLSYRSSKGPILRAAWGHYYQSPTYRELRYRYATSENTQSQRAEHTILGLEVPVNDKWTVKIEGYSKKMDDLISFERLGGHYVYSQYNDSKGFANGLDLYVNWTYSKLSGWLSYGYLVAKEDSLGDAKGYLPRATDQQHTLALVTDFDLGRSWELRVKALYGSGFPYTPYEMQLVDEENKVWEEVIGERNSARLPNFQRLDIRIGKHFTWGRTRIQTYIEAINALSRENVFMYDWNWNDGQWVREKITLMPFIPNFGIEVKY